MNAWHQIAAHTIAVAPTAPEDLTDLADGVAAAGRRSAATAKLLDAVAHEVSAFGVCFDCASPCSFTLCEKLHDFKLMVSRLAPNALYSTAHSSTAPPPQVYRQLSNRHSGTAGFLPADLVKLVNAYAAASYRDGTAPRMLDAVASYVVQRVAKQHLNAVRCGGWFRVCVGMCTVFWGSWVWKLC